jgi:valyl-tRNA synthetase
MMERFELGMAAQKVHDFLWNEYCDWYIEMAKPRFSAEEESKDTAIAVLNSVFADTLKLLHPFMPFITEEIYQSLPGTKGSIMISEWPKAGKVYAAEEKAMENVMELVRGIRNLRAEMNVPANRKASISILASKETRPDYEMCADYISRLAYASEIRFIESKAEIPENAVSVVAPGAEGYMPLGELVDIAKEIARLDAEAQRLNNEIKRSQGMLSNARFIEKAPESVVIEEKEKLKKYKEMLGAVLQRRSEFKI